MKINFSSTLVPFVFLTIMIGSTNLHLFSQSLQKITRLPSIVNETSGIEITGANQIWTFNDSGGEPELYLCDTLGNLIRTLVIDNAWNRDWEDITQDANGNFYIGNIGNNDNDNTDLTIFKIPNPDQVQGDLVTAEHINFSYGDQHSFPPPDDSLNFDCEALMWFEDHLYLCTKNRTKPYDGRTNLYRLPDNAGTYIAEKISSFDTGSDDMLTSWITAGDISLDGSKLTLLSPQGIWIFSDFVGDKFFSGNAQKIEFDQITQKEAICFISPDELYITDEEWIGEIGRSLYYINIEMTSTRNSVESQGNKAILAYPNPSSNYITLDGKFSHHHLEMIDVSGRKLISMNLTSQPQLINISKLDPGLYYLKITDRDKHLIQMLKVFKTNRS